MHTEVIIIGAGLAGLGAATRLKEAGISAKILEARDRVGGRISTNYQLGVAINCGAAWIHGDDGNPMTELARQSNTPRTPIIWESSENEFMTFDHAGLAIDHHTAEKFNEKFEKILEQAQKNAFTQQNDVTLANALQPEIRAANLTSVDEALLKRKLSYFEGYFGASYEKLSARYFNLEETWPGNNCYMPEGFQPIIHHLSEKCDIELNTKVNSIQIRDNEVLVATNHTSYIAKKVIITVPLGVLKANGIVFDPPLPEQKQKAIQKIGMGLLNITAIKFPEIFWPSEIAMFAQTNTKTLSIPAFLNLYRFTGAPILMGYHGGDRSRKIEALSDSELQEQIMCDLRKIFGSKCRNPIDMITTRWSNDPYTYGAYSYVTPSTTINDFDVLAESVANCLYFAGEATIGKYMATTHGAYLSGIREAEKIISGS